MTQESNTFGAPDLKLVVAGDGAAAGRLQERDLPTEVARLTEECERLRALASSQLTDMENVVRRKDEFIAMIGHDLKTPLTVIVGYARHVTQLLSMPSPDLAKVEHVLVVIQNHGRSMTSLLEELIDSSRIQLGELDVQRAPCDVGDSLFTVVSMLSHQERERLDVTVPAVTVVGHWDQRRVEQVLANLLGNALKYSPADSRVTVDVVRQDAGIEVSVSDHGIGILPDDLIHIFERFHRTAHARASGLDGTGLGLYICHCIVSAHGGSLWAESPGRDRGSTFRFTLPNGPVLGV